MGRVLWALYGDLGFLCRPHLDFLNPFYWVNCFVVNKMGQQTMFLRNEMDNSYGHGPSANGIFLIVD